jgi:excinuclease ABC subunit A
MQFLADVFVPCDQCDGMRFKPQVLDVKYRGKNIHQVLGMTVREALAFFSTSPKVLRPSAGARRDRPWGICGSVNRPPRCRVARRSASRSPRISRRSGGERLLYILDEPTTGLHFDDIAKLLTAFKKLVEAGHTLVVIEHNLDVIKTADYVIDLGPEGGEGGGEVIACRHAGTGRAGRGVAYRARAAAGAGRRAIECLCRSLGFKGFRRFRGSEGQDSAPRLL